MADGFEGLQVWQAAHALRVHVYRQVLPSLPREESWDLASQIRRSAKSIAANIAEGYGRFYFADNVRFCYNARCSLAETIDHLICARDLGYLAPDQYTASRAAADKVYRLLNGYIAYLKQRRLGADEPGANITVDGSAASPADPAGESTS